MKELILIPILAILLQIFLSGKENKWLGLILPGVTLIYSLLAVAGLAFYEGTSGWEVFATILTTFVLTNIPTMILLGIYAACRGKFKKNKALEKMNIQDLE